MKTVLLFLLLFILNACQIGDSVPTMDAETLRNNPITIPEFIRYVEIVAVFGESYCALTIMEGVIWRTGDYADDLRQHIYQNTIFTVDGENITDLVFPSDLNFPISVYAEDGTLIGTHGFEITVCMDIVEIPVGWHVARIEVQTTTGELYSYTWAFEVISESTD